MFVIEDNTGKFCKMNVGGKLTFVADSSEAYPFPSAREASDFIRKHWNKRARSHFKVSQLSEYVSEFQTVDISPDAKLLSPRASFSISDLQKEVERLLSKQIDACKLEISECEKKLSDVQHFLREKDTVLNVCESHLTVLKLQEVLRARCEAKKELQRLCILRTELVRAFQSSKEFSYSPYKNKIIPNVRKFLFTVD